MKTAITIFWFRRDLRLEDNAGLYYALKSGPPVLPVFIFDKNILDLLDNKTDRRVEFIYKTLIAIQEQLEKIHSTLDVRYGRPAEVFRQLLDEYEVKAVYTSTDYEPYATERDREIGRLLNDERIPFQSHKDQVVFEKNEVVKEDGSPYTIFTPYSRKWKTVLNNFYLSSYPTEKYFNHFLQQEPIATPTLRSIGFKATGEPFPADRIESQLLIRYQQQRDYPGVNGTTHLALHLRFGTISIRKLARKASELSETFLNELIWREFYQMILWHFPQVGKGKAFKPAFDRIQWRNDEKEFEKWCTGQTGYPFVDAGMRELNSTGFMHNRVRMVVASFLAKHLLIDWRWGETYFAERLLDFDLAANNGNWQWAAGCGCDAAPYFRVFNPALQAKKFDPDLRYIRRWVPELEELGYPPPIVDHEMARERAIKAYNKAVKGS
ncbi:MAG TPA: deoxyribodipyrimidine photo-lyase [Puia sp.]|uniref:cryptochrome/photolyase family protein n=1 Tax=Puia sp. TaxID=2045100 RepID=UPI002C3097B8|nr:deoxyribodipyrimidine photo-lyase [Puia sp.]HVU93791.1 deoxyribodipyrimidine photo-lyase [Puia sp.]